jgi:serine/threonine-protein kinase SRPK3
VTDLHSNNILFKLPGPDQWSEDDLYSRIGEPKKVPVKRLDNGVCGPEVPTYCVPPAMIFVSCEDVVQPHIIISDFGESFTTPDQKSESDPPQLKTPVTLLPPEAFFHERLGPAVDVWTLGCTVYEILGERPLFEGFMPDEDDITAEMVSTLGMLPDQWWAAWPKRGDFFTEDRAWKLQTDRVRTQISRPLRQRLYAMGRGREPETCEIGPDEMAALEQLLRAMLTYLPSERVTSSAALTSSWMRQWGLPGLKNQESLKFLQHGTL